MADYVGAIDQGTTSSRFMVFDHGGNEVGRHQLEHEQILPRAGWVEHNPVEIWERTSTAVRTCMKDLGIQASDLAAVGITNQRETTVVWDRTTGRPFHNAIVWQDTRTDRIAAAVDDSGGLVFVPAFSGLFAPRWRSDARGVIVGMSRFSIRNHLARAALEAIYWQSRDVIDALREYSGVEVEVLRVDGGVTANELCMQIQADVVGVDVSRPVVAETTALGAAYAAGLAVGFWSDTDALRANWNEDRRWTPQWDDEQRAAGHAQWNKAVDRTLDWVDVD
ncbi:MAG TPA: FGGY family carbohydrate kinase [Nitriliruptoraceae bacterium]|nr:FGGY family carbohydrate kinase [Nitriliruptoraceae bacterium]